MKISSMLRRFFALPPDQTEFQDTSWADDPYAHPAISAMNERERADLPPVHPVVRSVTLGGSPSPTAVAGLACV
jgi:hypothetical protein